MREHTDWSAEVETEVKQSLIRLANLANDDNQQDDNLTVEEHYHFRLARLLNEGKLLDPSADLEVMAPHNPPHTKVPGPGEPGDPFAWMRNVKSPAPHILAERERAALERRNRDNMFAGQLDANKKNVDSLAAKFEDKLNLQQKENQKLKDELAELRAEMASVKSQMQGSNSTTKLGDDATGAQDSAPSS